MLHKTSAITYFDLPMVSSKQAADLRAQSQCQDRCKVLACCVEDLARVCLAASGAGISPEAPMQAGSSFILGGSNLGRRTGTSRVRLGGTVLQHLNKLMEELVRCRGLLATVAIAALRLETISVNDACATPSVPGFGFILAVPSLNGSTFTRGGSCVWWRSGPCDAPSPLGPYFFNLYPSCGRGATLQSGEVMDGGYVDDVVDGVAVAESDSQLGATFILRPPECCFTRSADARWSEPRVFFVCVFDITEMHESAVITNALASFHADVAVEEEIDAGECIRQPASPARPARQPRRRPMESRGSQRGRLCKRAPIATGLLASKRCRKCLHKRRRQIEK